MKVNLLDAHDRLKELYSSQANVVAQGAEDCLKKNWWSLLLQEYCPYIYIYGHARTLGLDERLKLFNTGRYISMAVVPEKKILWHPRIVKPLAESNSFLMRAKSGSDVMEICWILPPREMWDQFTKQTMFQDKVVKDAGGEKDIVPWSIQQFLHNKQRLESPFPEDLTATQVKMVYRKIDDHLKTMKIENNAVKIQLHQREPFKAI